MVYRLTDDFIHVSPEPQVPVFLLRTAVRARTWCPTMSPPECGPGAFSPLVASKANPLYQASLPIRHRSLGRHILPAPLLAFWVFPELKSAIFLSLLILHVVFKSTVRYCTVMYCFVLYFTVLNYILLYCNLLYCNYCTCTGFPLYQLSIGQGCCDEDE